MRLQGDCALQFVSMSRISENRSKSARMRGISDRLMDPESGSGGANSSGYGKNLSCVGLARSITRAAYEARYISQVLDRTSRYVSHAALAPRVSRVALQKKIKRYGRR
jgi:DNA-binding NtrC family response regulator